MQITSLALYHVALPLRQSRVTAGRPCTALETVLVRMASGDAVGWGEASPGNGPTASDEWAAGTFSVLRDWLAPAVVGTTIDSGDDLTERLAPFRGNRFAKSALDTAWWDLSARLQDRPLHELLGAEPAAVEVGPTLDRMDSPDEFLAAIGGAFDAGFARVKLKFRPGWDIEMLRFVRQHFPTQTFHVDCEGALGLEQTEMLCRLDDFFLAMIEQPLPADDLVGNAMVQEMVRTPVCLDEGVTTPGQAEIAVDLNSCRFLNLKPGRVGGLTAALAILDACRAGGIQCWGGAVPQSAIGSRIGLALAAKAGRAYPADLFPAGDVLVEDLAEPLTPVRDPADGIARVALWRGAGLGIEPDAAILERCTLQKVVC